MVGESGERLRSDKRYATDLRWISFRSDSSPLDVMMMMTKMTVMMVMTVMTMLTISIMAKW